VTNTDKPEPAALAALQRAKTQPMRLRKKFLQIPKVSKDYKPKISASALAEVKENFEAYCSLILQSDLAPNSQNIYIEAGDKFVRWLSGRFTPGSRSEGVYGGH